MEIILITAEHWGKRAAEEVLIKDGYEPIIAKAEADDWWQSVRDIE